VAGERDFFISYTGADVAWAEWIAQTLEDAGYQTVVQAWDFRPGQDFVHQMQQATQQAARTIAVLSPAYLGSAFGEAEWRVALASDTVPRASPSISRSGSGLGRRRAPASAPGPARLGVPGRAAGGDEGGRLASSTSVPISPVWAGSTEAWRRPPSARRPPTREASRAGAPRA
jgi:TIR domain